MPPKRAAPSRASASASNKRARTSTASNSDEPPRSKRWAAMSGSANADADYKTTWKNPEKWYSYMTICPPLMGEDDEEEEEKDDDEDTEEEESEGENEDEDGDEDEDEDGARDGPKCSKNCVCFKPASKNPDHPWLVSQAGYRKFTTQRIHAQLRDPDNFDMYTFNDHAGYGILEVVQNLFLDFVEAAERGWKEQWAVCEAMVLWLLHPASGMLMNIDDSERVDATLRLVGRMFLYMLAKLDDEDLVGDATSVRDLGCMMALYMKLANQTREAGFLDSAAAGRGSKKTLQPDRFEDAILSYANKRGVTLQGPSGIDELAADLDGDLELPKKGAADPWGWKAALKKYTKDYAGATGFAGRRGTPGIGGDNLDITTWTSAERKAKSFGKRDPLGKKEIDAIKQGMVMQLG